MEGNGCYNRSRFGDLMSLEVGVFHPELSSPSVINYRFTMLLIIAVIKETGDRDENPVQFSVFAVSQWN